MMKAVVRKGLLKNHKWPKLEPSGHKVTCPGLWKPGTATSPQYSCCPLHQNYSQPTGWLWGSLFPVGKLACKCCWLGGPTLPCPVSYGPICSAIKPHCLVAGSQAAVPLNPLLAPQVWEFISPAPYRALVSLSRLSTAHPGLLHVRHLWAEIVPSSFPKDCGSEGCPGHSDQVETVEECMFQQFVYLYMSLCTYLCKLLHACVNVYETVYHLCVSLHSCVRDCA